MALQLAVTVIFNSSVEDVLGWKCCNLQDMNLEIQVTNRGREVARVKSVIVLKGEAGSERIDYLYPHGVHPIAPGEGLSFYCRFDEDRFARFTHAIAEDEAGTRYRAPITGRAEPAETQ
jgi:hypothetical protein